MSDTRIIQPPDNYTFAIDGRYYLHEDDRWYFWAPMGMAQNAWDSVPQPLSPLLDVLETFRVENKTLRAKVRELTGGGAP